MSQLLHWEHIAAQTTYHRPLIRRTDPTGQLSEPHRQPKFKNYSVIFHTFALSKLQS